MPLSNIQYETLRRPLNSSRVAKRSQGGKQLSYLESYDVRAHLIRIFGYGNFDVITQDAYHVGTREYGTEEKPMVEVIWYARVMLHVRVPYSLEGQEGVERLATYCESAVGSASGPINTLGDLHDNAVKTAASDAMKRCAINLGTQFGLSLYDNGATGDVVKNTIAPPPGYEKPKEEEPTEEQIEALKHSLGAREVTEEAVQG